MQFIARVFVCLCLPDQMYYVPVTLTHCGFVQPFYVDDCEFNFSIIFLMTGDI